MDTRVIENIKLFHCENNDCWMTDQGCDTIREAADNAAYCIKAGVMIDKIDEINLQRCSECVGCPKYVTLTEAEFIEYIQPIIDEYSRQIEAMEVDSLPHSEVEFGLSEFDSKRARDKRWYIKHFKREATDG